VAVQDIGTGSQLRWLANELANECAKCANSTVDCLQGGACHVMTIWTFFWIQKKVRSVGCVGTEVSRDFCDRRIKVIHRSPSLRRAYIWQKFWPPHPWRSMWSSAAWAAQRDSVMVADGLYDAKWRWYLIEPDTKKK
jgi:hypothetical protein